ncbi:MAG: ABC transporter permease [Chloroflexi bacterium]|nr:ABC transporter permease [Chloroflexota bacterium]
MVATDLRSGQQAPDIATARPLVRRRSPLIADLRGIYIIWYRDLLRWWRDRQRILPSLVQPILYLFVFGVGLGSAIGGGAGGSNNSASALGVSYTTFMYPGVLAMSVLFTAIFSAMSIVWDREFGFLKEIQVAPLRRASVAIGKALGGSTVAMIQASLLLLISPLVGIALTPLLVLQTLGLMFLLAFTLSAMGVAIASRMKSMEGFQVVMNFVMMPILFLSGAFFPLRGLPVWLEALTRIDPAAYAVDALRRVVLTSAGVPQAGTEALAINAPGGGAIPIAVEVLILALLSVPALVLAVRWFGKTD